MTTSGPADANVLYQGDNARAIAALPAKSLALCYLDPPFFTGRERTGQELHLGTGGRLRCDERSGRSFTWTDDAWEGDTERYLVWLGERLEGIRGLLSRTGSLLVHLDWRMCHEVKVLLDRLFGRKRLVNEIIWHYSSGSGRTKRCLARKHDTILWYAKTKHYTCNLDATAQPRNLCRLCGTDGGRKNHMRRELDQDGRLVRTIRSGGRIYRYYDDDPAPASDVWLDISHIQQRSPERTGYPTQKPLALLERLVLLCSNPGDVVADFFMGSGTSLVAAALHGRSWLGCDVSPEAVALTAERLRSTIFGGSGGTVRVVTPAGGEATPSQDTPRIEGREAR